MDLKNKKIIILGLGREGLSTLSYLSDNFPESEVAVADQMLAEQLPEEVLQRVQTLKAKKFLGPDYLDAIKDYDVVIKSAGIPLKLVMPHAKNKQISSATEIFFGACKNPIIGVTGTKGKSTTTALIFEVLKAAGKDVVLCGNIGKPALDFLSQLKEHTIVVMELSSHQLQTLTKSPHIAVLQNIVPEHLDYYEDFNDYVAAKEHITQFQTDQDYLLYNANYPIPYEIAQRSRAKRIPFNSAIGQTCCFVKNDEIVYRTNGKDEIVINTVDAGLKGEFNLQNILPAVVIGKFYNVSSSLIAGVITSFRGLEDRLEFVGNIGGVDYYNDSLSTIPEAAIAAMEALGQNVETLIAGGFDRGLDFANLGIKIVGSNIKTVILFPETGGKIWSAIEASTDYSLRSTDLEHFFVNSMAEAVKIAKEHTAKGKICLLSPAAPSFGIFKDYHDRGLQFKQAVNQS